MTRTRFVLFFMALSCGAGWFFTHKPHSPADDLPGIQVAAFEFAGPVDAPVGQRTAEAARKIQGVTSASFNPASGLLGMTFLMSLPEKTLAGKLSAAAGLPVSRKIFPEPTGAKCPVPARLLAELPGWLALLTGVFAALLLLTFLPKPLLKKEKGPADRPHEGSISNHFLT